MEKYKSNNPVLWLDMDGTICNAEHRIHHVEKKPKNWKAFFEAQKYDKPYEFVLNFIKDVYPKHDIVVVTGRPDEYMNESIEWLNKYNVPFKAIYMKTRKIGYHTADYVAKEMMLKEYLMDECKVDVAFEDKPAVIEMLKKYPIKIHKCVEGEIVS